MKIENMFVVLGYLKESGTGSLKLIRIQTFSKTGPVADQNARIQIQNSAQPILDTGAH